MEPQVVTATVLYQIEKHLRYTAAMFSSLHRMLLEDKGYALFPIVLESSTVTKLK